MVVAWHSKFIDARGAYVTEWVMSFTSDYLPLSVAGLNLTVGGHVIQLACGSRWFYPGIIPCLQNCSEWHLPRGLPPQITVSPYDPSSSNTKIKQPTVWFAKMAPYIPLRILHFVIMTYLAIYLPDENFTHRYIRCFPISGMSYHIKSEGNNCHDICVSVCFIINTVHWFEIQ